MHNRDKFLLICGVPIANVPVLSHFIDWIRNRGGIVECLDYKGKNAIAFLVRAVRLCLRYRQNTVVFANVQSAFVLRLVQFLPLRMENPIYWAFESAGYTGRLSPVVLGIFSEKILRHRDVSLIIPIEERAPFFAGEYRRVEVVENTALAGEPFIKRTISKGERIKLVFYGGLSPHLTYVTEILDLVRRFPAFFELSLFGSVTGKEVERWESENIKFLGRKAHHELIEALRNDFHFSVIGYKPIDFNHEYCAPNKLFESFGLSLPVLGNMRNPTIRRIISEWGGGLLADFGDLVGDALFHALSEDYQMKNKQAYQAYTKRFNFNLIAGQTECFK